MALLGNPLPAMASAFLSGWLPRNWFVGKARKSRAKSASEAATESAGMTHVDLIKLAKQLELKPRETPEEIASRIKRDEAREANDLYQQKAPGGRGAPDDLRHPVETELVLVGII